MNKTIIVTGSSGGLGTALCKSFIQDGNLVIGFSRSSNSDLNIFGQRYLEFQGDIGDANQVRVLLDLVRTNSLVVQGIVHCAGKYGPLGRIETVQEMEWDDAIKVNLMGTFNILKLACELFHRQELGHFVCLSGGGATSPMPRALAYAASKSAVVRLVESVSEDYSTDNVSFNCVAPGLMPGRMLREVLEAGPEISGSEFYSRMKNEEFKGTDSTSQAIDLIKHLIYGNSPRVTGRLISAVWDDWRNLFLNQQYLSEKSLHTLRRLTT